MKKKLFIIPVLLLSTLLVVMIVSTAFGLDATTTPMVQDAESYVNNFCFKEEGGISAKEMDVSDVVKKYTDKTNKFFNENIAYIMTHPDEQLPSINLNDSGKSGGLCKLKDDKNQTIKDTACQAISMCKGNHSAYCVGITLLGFSPERYQNYDDASLKNFPQLKYSYFCYKAVLESKINSIYDGTPGAILAKCDTPGNQVADETVCKLKTEIAQEKNPSRKEDLQRQLNAILSTGSYWGSSATGAAASLTMGLVDLADNSVKRVQFIDDQIIRAKQALDQTLDAYSQLKTAWSMHIKYMDIFAELVKYRDHLVAIRKQTDTFPFKFIDATTTKCL